MSGEVLAELLPRLLRRELRVELCKDRVEPPPAIVVVALLFSFLRIIFVIVLEGEGMETISS